MKALSCWMVCAVLSALVLGCGSGGGEPPRTQEGTIARPEGLPSPADEKAAYLKRAKEGRFNP